MRLTYNFDGLFYNCIIFIPFSFHLRSISISSTFHPRLIYVPLPPHLCSIPVPPAFHPCPVYIPSTSRLYSIHVPSIFHLHSLYVPWATQWLRRLSAKPHAPMALPARGSGNVSVFYVLCCSKFETCPNKRVFFARPGRKTQASPN